MTVYYSKEVTADEEFLKSSEIPYSIDTTQSDQNILLLLLNSDVSVGEFITIPTIFYYVIPTSRRKLGATYSSFSLIKGVSAKISLTSTGDASNVVTQSISTSLAIQVVQRSRSTLTLQGINVGSLLNPKIQLTAISNYATTISGNPMRYRFYR